METIVVVKKKKKKEKHDQRRYGDGNVISSTARGHDRRPPGIGSRCPATTTTTCSPDYFVRLFILSIATAVRRTTPYRT